MKITQQQLRRIIKEELTNLREEDGEEQAIIPAGRFQEIKNADQTGKDLMKSNDPVVRDLGVIFYYATKLALTKVPGTPEARQGNAETFKGEIVSAVDSLISKK